MLTKEISEVEQEIEILRVEFETWKIQYEKEEDIFEQKIIMQRLENITTKVKIREASFLSLKSAQAKFEDEIRIKDAQIDYQIRRFYRFVEDLKEGVRNDKNMIISSLDREDVIGFIDELSSKEKQ